MGIRTGKMYTYRSIDLTELELPNTMTTHFPDPTDVLNFKLTITPDEGQYPYLSHITPRGDPLTGPIQRRKISH